MGRTKGKVRVWKVRVGGGGGGGGGGVVSIFLMTVDTWSTVLLLK